MFDLVWIIEAFTRPGQIIIDLPGEDLDVLKTQVFQHIGKIGALQVMFKAVPGEVIAYCDDDVFYLPGWLEKHLEILDTFPKVGVISGMYIKPHMKEGIQSTLKFAKSKGVSLKKAI